MIQRNRHRSKMKRKRLNSKREQHNNTIVISDEDSLSNLENSLEKLASISITSTSSKDEDLTYKAAPKISRQSNGTSLQNSVIIINDSESELSDNGRINSSALECSSNTSTGILQQSSLLKRPRKQLNNISRRRTRSSVIVIEDSPSSSSSDVHKSLKRTIDGENIAPSKAEDDVVELWSCTNKSPSRNEKNSDYKNNRKEEKFAVDRKPDFTNLDYISINTSPLCKRQKRWNYCDKDLPVNKFDIHALLEKSLNKRQRRKLNRKHVNKVRLVGDEKSKKEEKSDTKRNLREIVIDGCNVAMAHTNGRVFSVKGIELMVDYFVSKGHIVKVFLPQHVRGKSFEVLEKMYKNGVVVFTPSRRLDGKRITSYDDRFILEYATKCGGIVISADQYRDLYKEKPEWRDTIMNRLLTPTFVGDYIMFPEDPLGKSGPNLDTFLRY